MVSVRIDLTVGKQRQHEQRCDLSITAGCGRAACAGAGAWGVCVHAGRRFVREGLCMDKRRGWGYCVQGIRAVGGGVLG